ncbi:TrmH family RNA methyltransferase [Nocardioides cavernae]|uniref:TrmH family RNA methyltransferase n=1 Tax=Nocardioides cavernae TaxID=1921566 RepID=A0A7Y9H5Y6_9ACTN|nr:TrmH family RNA methyltransferase [Nocardioides cavernae]NYE38251.1 TrmH family RNA methyltransferase [Nocardioides cavernae]
MADLRITRENARFQQWEALLTNRSKRHRNRELLVQGVRPLTRAVEEGWRVRALLRAEGSGSSWAEDLWSSTDAERVVLSPDLHARLSGREDGAELVAVVEMPEDGVERLADSTRPHGPVVVLDRPTSPGNIGTLARSADAFGAAALVVTGHAADPYDPQAVRASTGSLFALTVLRVPGPGPVVEWAHAHGYRIVGTDEEGTTLAEVDLTGRVVLVVGNETHGLSSGWRAACDDVASIPMVGSASSLNAAVAGSIVLHHALQQRG